jgi:hypothetical protein
MRVKVTSSERFTWNAVDYQSGQEVDIPDHYAEQYVDAGLVEKVHDKKSTRKASK